MPEEMFKELARSVLEDTKDLLGTPGNPHEMKLFCTVYKTIYLSREINSRIDEHLRTSI